MFGENITTFIIPTAAYALIMMITSIIFIFIIRKILKILIILH